jgi:hypothetical protein
MRTSYIISCCSEGILNLWIEKAKKYSPLIQQVNPEETLTVCGGLYYNDDKLLIGAATAGAEVHIYSCSILDEAKQLQLVQKIGLKKAIANEVIFHKFGTSNDILLALGLSTGDVTLYDLQRRQEEDEPSPGSFVHVLNLSKHEDWVRCIDFTDLGISITIKDS